MSQPRYGVDTPRSWFRESEVCDQIIFTMLTQLGEKHGDTLHMNRSRVTPQLLAIWDALVAYESRADEEADTEELSVDQAEALYAAAVAAAAPTIVR